jgi:DNA-directed RNA polymerase specialized sigma24 family protein
VQLLFTSSSFHVTNEVQLKQSTADTVPATYDELFKTYGPFISQRLRRLNKVDRHLEDLIQDVYLKLIQANVIEKFKQSTLRKLPESMTAVQATEFLGITWQRWCSAMSAAKNEKVWMPRPAVGTNIYGRNTEFHTSDILLLEETGYFSKRDFERKQLDPSPGRGFRAYLCIAVSNHFKNWCRTRTRRYQEFTLPPQEDGQSWEGALLQNQDLCIEDTITLVQELERHGINPDTPAGEFAVDCICRGDSLQAVLMKTREFIPQVTA